jgi:hypothetical protein
MSSFLLVTVQKVLYFIRSCGETLAIVLTGRLHPKAANLNG